MAYPLSQRAGWLRNKVERKVKLSKKRSQAKSRGQSDLCHTSVIFMPAFPWHQMGGEVSHRLVSTLSYLLYT
jgi:hypothetical protein